MPDITAFGNPIVDVEEGYLAKDSKNVQVRFIGVTFDVTLFLRKEVVEELHISYKTES